jgi:iron complex outermembrane recepter protein
MSGRGPQVVKLVRMGFRNYNRAWAFVLCLLVSTLMRAYGTGPPAIPMEFHIEGGDATETLTDYSRQARLQLLFDYNVVKGHTTEPLNGTFKPEEALRKLLAETDLEFDFVNDHTLAVMRKKEPELVKAAGNAKVARRASRRSHNGVTDDGDADAIQEVVRVTGTYMRDEDPVGQEIISANRADIESTGAATVPDFLSTLPQTFGGGPNQDTYIGDEAQSNTGRGVGENLRGLGARATLVLIDGRRVAPSGDEGEFVDVENIPLTAIDRIDILPDSASATYGADAVGGVVNFILRDRFDGAETIARGGSGTRGDLQEYLFSQTLGKVWDSGSGLVSFEVYHRGSLPAADRAYATSDLRSFGGGDFDTFETNPGNILVPTATGVQTYAIPAGQNGQHLATAGLVAGTENQQNQYLDSAIIPSQQRWNFYTNFQQSLNDQVDLFTQVLWGHREAQENYSGAAEEFQVPSSNPFYYNPTGGTSPVLVAYNFGKDLGLSADRVGINTLNATLGLDFDLAGTWGGRVYGNYSRERQNYTLGNEVSFDALDTYLADTNPATAFNPFGDGSYTNPTTLQAIRTTYRSWLDSQLRTLDAAFDGTVTDTHGGPVKLAFGVDRRQQIFQTSQSALETGAGTSPANDADLSRTVTSLFSELVTPLVGKDNSLPGISRLALSAAARYENYSSLGGATTPKFGIQWSPYHDLSLRGSWSRALRPPTLSDLDTGRNQATSLALPDARVTGGRAPALIWSGGNSNLRPEHARSWTGGLDWAPTQVPGFAVGLTYFNTRFTDRIQSTQPVASMLTDPAYAPLITYNPSAAQIANVCEHSTYTQGTLASCLATPAVAIVDVRIRNLATLETNGMDFNIRYDLPLPVGKLRMGLNGTWLSHFEQAQLPDTALVSLLNTENEPINLRMRGSAGWEFAGFGASIATNFTNSYWNTSSTPAQRVDSWTTVDVQLRYDFSDDSGFLHGTRLEMNARNVFNIDPPYLDNQVTYIGYDQENANPYGRQLSLELRKTW